ALVGFMESYSIAKAVDTDKSTQINPNKELLALGFANLIGAFFRTFPAAGGFSRSAVNHQAGANTPLASILSALLVALALLFFTNTFNYLPTAILASIIMVAITKLIDVNYIIRLFRVNRVELLILFITFLTTLLISMIGGILVGIALSILHLIFKSAYPHIAELGRVRNYHEFRNIHRFKDLERWPNLLILRVDASLSFINIQFLKDYVQNAVANADDQLNTIILDAAPVSSMDATAAHGMKELLHDLHRKGIRFMICELIGPVRDTFHRTGLIDHIGAENIFFDLSEAVDAANTNAPGKFQEYAIQSNYKTGSTNE
ncbi:MAG: SulP family inorganic anion transporter, partial [Bacteroidota bacterium]